MLLGVSLGVSLVARTEARRQVHARQPVAQLTVDDLQGDFGAPIAVLASALQRNRTARFFRVSWDATWGGWGSSQTALYDRRRKTVKFFSIGGEQGNVVVRQHYLFTGVTEAALEHQANDLAAVTKRLHSIQSGSSDAFFEDLPKYGAVRHTYPDN